MRITQQIREKIGPYNIIVRWDRDEYRFGTVKDAIEFIEASFAETQENKIEELFAESIKDQSQIVDLGCNWELNLEVLE